MTDYEMKCKIEIKKEIADETLMNDYNAIVRILNLKHKKSERSRLLTLRRIAMTYGPPMRGPFDRSGNICVGQECAGLY